MCNCKLLSWDVGYVNHGIALFNFDDSYIELLYSKYVRTDYEKFGANLEKFEKVLEDIIKKSNIDIFVYEKPVFKKGNSASFLNQMLGIVTLQMYKNNISMYPVTATEVKKTMCGKGNADKHEIESAVNKFLKIDKKYERDHESDAVAIGITYWLKNINS